MLFIDPEECIDCCACSSLCPTEAIFVDHEVPDKWQEYIELNAEMVQRTPSITEERAPKNSVD